MDHLPKHPFVKQQHYLPKAAYLNYFTDDRGKLKVYELEGDKKEFYNGRSYSPQPNSVGKEAWLYEVPSRPTNTLEKYLASVEEEYHSVLKDKIIPQKKLTGKDISVVSMFLAVLEMRVPAQRDFMLSQLEHLKQRGIRMAKANGGSSEEFERDMTRAQEDMMLTNIIAAKDINRWQYSDFCFLSIPSAANESYFITSDNPTTLVDFKLMNSFYGIPPLSNSVEFVTPLTCKVAIFVNNVGVSGYKDVRHNFIDEINNRVVNMASKYVISSRTIDSKFYDRIHNRYPQSLVLEYMPLRKGRLSRLAKKYSKEER